MMDIPLILAVFVEAALTVLLLFPPRSLGGLERQLLLRGHIGCDLFDLVVRVGQIVIVHVTSHPQQPKAIPVLDFYASSRRARIHIPRAPSSNLRKRCKCRREQARDGRRSGTGRRSYRVRST